MKQQFRPGPDWQKELARWLGVARTHALDSPLTIWLAALYSHIANAIPRAAWHAGRAEKTKRWLAPQQHPLTARIHLANIYPARHLA
jgi:hypothetical protein